MVMSDVKKEIYKGIDSYSAKVTRQIAETKRDLNQGKFKRTFKRTIYKYQFFALHLKNITPWRAIALFQTLLRRNPGVILSVKLVRR